MADKHFFDLLKDKIAEFRPSEQHREHDWAALGERLNNAPPDKAREKRRAIVLPLLLLSALLSTNAAWLQSNYSDRATIAKLATTVSDLQARIAATAIAPRETVRTDTVWRTVYVRQFDRSKNLAQATEKQAPSTLPMVQASTGSAVAVAGLDSISRIPDLYPLKLAKLALLEIPGHQVSTPKSLVINALNDKNIIEPFGKNRLKSLRPKFFIVGASSGWLYANSTALMHKGGFSGNLHGQFGLSRHWSITSNFGMSRVHYKSHLPNAILGTPALPAPPSMDHHLAEMEVTGQKIRQFDLGLRYTFAQPGKPRPFIGLDWGRQTLLPFTIEYEIQHELTGTIHKEIFQVTTKTALRNILGISLGIEIPLSPRVDLNLEGFYQRQWKNPQATAPNLSGIKAGLNWHF